MHRVIEEFRCFLFYLSMLIDGVLWPSRVGIFHAFKFQTQVKSNMKNPLLFLLYFCSGIEINPGPKQSSLNFCYWYLNDVAAHEFLKVLLLQGYITEHNFNIICLSETFLNSCLDSKDDTLIDHRNTELLICSVITGYLNARC